MWTAYRGNKPGRSLKRNCSFDTRIKNKIDLITLFSGWLMGYRDVGDELLVDSQNSPYFKQSKNPGDWHNLEAHLHMVARTQGVGNPFKLVINLDVALINKSQAIQRFGTQR